MGQRMKIVLLPGDGIGPEVTAAAVRVLQAAAKQFQIELHLQEQQVGAGAYLDCGNPLPDEAFAACEEADAVLLGAMGLPSVRWPDGREMTPQIDLRERLDLYEGLRPIRLYAESDSPLKTYGAGDIDFLLVRENTEGLFAARKDSSTTADEARDIMRITRDGSRRIFESAFKAAMLRRKKVTLVDKANVLPSMVFFRSVFEEVAADYPEVETECVYVDAAALFLVQRPESFDVIVTENMFGDILSDLAAGLVGGMGMAPSADIGERCAVFQPAHGTAPDIADQGKANPIATILSAAMMVDWLGQSDCANAIETAVANALKDTSLRTGDMGGTATTDEMTNAVLSQLELV
ncbi:MAG: isocitrate/isopropylmalate dehydrogenase family protein [Planctomycetaceae bacterium]